jgi:hypothetical protein
MPLPTRISPLAAPEESDSGTFCAESAALPQYATNSSGWTWGIPLDEFRPCPHPNCKTRGFYAAGAGKTLEFQIDTQSSVRSADGALPTRRSLVGIYYNARSNGWPARMGVAQLSCVSGCSCSPVVMGLTERRQALGNLAAASTEVRLWLERSFLL